MYLASLSRVSHSIDICTVAIKNIRHMHGVSTNQVVDNCFLTIKVYKKFTLLNFSDYIKEVQTFSRALMSKPLIRVKTIKASEALLQQLSR